MTGCNEDRDKIKNGRHKRNAVRKRNQLELQLIKGASTIFGKIMRRQTLRKVLDGDVQPRKNCVKQETQKALTKNTKWENNTNVGTRKTRLYDSTTTSSFLYRTNNVTS